MRSGREVVRVRAGRDVHDRMRVDLRGRAPAAPLTEAVLAVADELGLLVLREDDVHDLPVALVRLPDEVARRIGVRVGVVVVEVPVLEHDRARWTGDASVHDACALAFGSFRRVTGEPARKTVGVQESWFSRQMPVPGAGSSPGSGSASTSDQAPASNCSRSESATNDCMLAGRNCSTGSRWVTGWYFSRSRRSTFSAPATAGAQKSRERNADCDGSAVGGDGHCCPPCSFVELAERRSGGMPA